MSRFMANILIQYEITDFDDAELELRDGVNLTDLSDEELEDARQEFVASTFSKAEPTCFIIEISDLP